MQSKHGGKKRKKTGRIRKLDTIKNRRKLKRKAEALIHLYVRKMAVDSSGNVQCFTCRKTVPYEMTNAGHRHHNRLDLDLRNLKAQCIRCNRHLSGNLGEYERTLIETHGLDWAKQLKQDADNDTRQYTYQFLKETIEKYTSLLFILSKSSGEIK